MKREIQVGLIAALATLLVSCSRPAALPVSPPSAPSHPVTAQPRISLDELAQAMVDLPAWPAGSIEGCPSGRFQFQGRYTRVSSPHGPMMVGLAKTVDVDVDHDGVDETIAWITCALQGGTAQVLAFKRDAAGAILTLGQVVGGGGGSGMIHDVTDIRADLGGSVGVQVADLGSIDGSDVFRYAQTQWRGYGWTGKGFTQTSGPTAFPPNAHIVDLAVTVTDLHLGPGLGWGEVGAITVTIRNNGTGSPAKVELQVHTETALTLHPPAGVDCVLPNTGASTRGYRCTLAAPAPGGSRTFAFRLTADSKLTGTQPDGQVDVLLDPANYQDMVDSPGDNGMAKFPVIVD